MVICLTHLCSLKNARSIPITSLKISACLDSEMSKLLRYTRSNKNILFLRQLSLYGGEIRHQYRAAVGLPLPVSKLQIRIRMWMWMWMWMSIRICTLTLTLTLTRIRNRTCTHTHTHTHTLTLPLSHDQNSHQLAGESYNHFQPGIPKVPCFISPRVLSPRRIFSPVGQGAFTCLMCNQFT